MEADLAISVTTVLLFLGLHTTPCLVFDYSKSKQQQQLLHHFIFEPTAFSLLHVRSQNASSFLLRAVFRPRFYTSIDTFPGLKHSLTAPLSVLL